MNQARLTEVIGWIGMGFIVLAYLLVSLEIVAATDWHYQALNLLGASGVVWISYKRRLMQTLVLNLFWGAIAVTALVGVLL